MQVCARCGERNPDRAGFCMTCGEPLGAVVTEASRRYVTVLFADLKDSTRIGEQLDPETLLAVLARFFAVAREVLERHGGTVEKFIGDAVLAVFGSPRAHEDDALRAVIAARELQEVLGRLNEEELISRFSVGLELRIGVNTGEVVASDPAIGSTFVAGDAVNVAARLEQSAPAGEVFLGVETYAQVANAIEAEPVEPLELKGKSDRVPAYRLISVLAGPATRSHMPFVGRREELEQLDLQLRTAIETSSVRRIILAGPPGIGKTRLADEATSRWGDRAEHWFTRCAPEGEDDLREPLVALLATGLGVDPRSPEELAEAVRQRMAEHERAPLVSSALARSIVGGDGALAEETAWALSELVAASAARRTIAMIVDDAHWAAPQIGSILDEIASRVRGPLIQVLIVLPEYELTGGAEVATVRLDLGPLDEPRATELVTAVVGSADAAMTDQIVQAGRGNPLFLIETARMVRERSGQGEGALEGFAVPSSIRGVVAARLDRVSPDELRFLETAAVVGRSFEFDSVRPLLPESLRERAEDIAEHLAARGLLDPIGSAPGQDLFFAHGLVREVVYETTTKERRAHLHEQHARRSGSADPAVIAHHLEVAFRLRTELGMRDEHQTRTGWDAVASFASAGAQAVQVGNRKVASGFLDHIDQLIADLPDDGDRSVLARGNAGQVAYGLGEWGAVERLLEPVVGSGDLAVTTCLGQALAQANRSDPNGAQMTRARGLLSRASHAGNADATASLAGTLKGSDDAEALRFYRLALEQDPGNPYAIGNVLEYELQRARDLSPLDLHHSSIEAATARRRGQVALGEDLPWSCFDLAKLSLLVADEDQAFQHACLAVARSTAPFMIRTSLRSLELIANIEAGLTGLEPIRLLYELGLAALFKDIDAEAAISDKRTPRVRDLATPIAVVVGGSAREVDEHVRAFGPVLETAFASGSGTVISGGTTTGVGAVAGDIARSSGGAIAAVGYLPTALPSDVLPDVDPSRYAEIRRTMGSGFSVAEPLAYWTDILGQDVDPSDVRVLGLGGGRLAAAEYRIALALGASVGILRGSGREASALLRHRLWGTSPALIELPADAQALQDFLAHG